MKINIQELEELLLACEEASTGDSIDAEIDASLALQEAVQSIVDAYNSECRHDGDYLATSEGRECLTCKELF